MPADTRSVSHHHHDWHSRDYVARWIDEDVTRDGERRPILRRMLDYSGFASDAAIRLLDIGAGYGVVAEEVLRAFPAAQVTWQDYSEPMRQQAEARLTAFKDRLRFALGDLAEPGWEKGVGGPFELVVSGIALHNLRDRAAIFRCYGVIRSLLAPEGCFLDYDYFQYAGGLDLHREAIAKAGFERVECPWQAGTAAILVAR
jgi:2-polyprenyl-3-methyl-5-hydroxy-6-metoxy-1,4-benzoquinol methylase